MLRVKSGLGEMKMLFGDQLKRLRLRAGFSQKELAGKTGLSVRSIQNYESNSRHPKDVEILGRLASALGAGVSELMPGGGVPLLGVDALVSELQALFAGGELGEEDKEAVFRAISDAYLDAREKNRKYGKK